MTKSSNHKLYDSEEAERIVKRKSNIQAIRDAKAKIIRDKINELEEEKRIRASLALDIL